MLRKIILWISLWMKTRKIARIPNIIVGKISIEDTNSPAHKLIVDIYLHILHDLITGEKLEESVKFLDECGDNLDVLLEREPPESHWDLKMDLAQAISTGHRKLGKGILENTYEKVCERFEL